MHNAGGMTPQLSRVVVILCCVHLALSTESVFEDQKNIDNSIKTTVTATTANTTTSPTSTPSTGTTSDSGVTTAEAVTLTKIAAEDDKVTTRAAEDDSSTSFTSATYSTASTSTPALIVTRLIEHIGKRSVETEDLPDAACKHEDGAQHLQTGTFYNIYQLVYSTDGWDEHGKLQVECKLSDEVRDKKCQDWVGSTVENVQLEINGTRKDDEFEKEYSADKDTVIFNGKLHYESHDKAEFSCVHSESKSGAKFVSLNKTVSRVDELHQFTITPEELHLTIGESFALTCTTDSDRGLGALQWKVKKNDDGVDRPLKPGSKTELGLNYRIIEFQDELHSVLNVTTENDGKYKSRIDYTFYCTEKYLYHSKQNLGEAKVTIHPVDNSLRNGLIGTGVVVLNVIAILIVVFLWRRRKRRAALAVSIRMTETRNAIMQIARQTSNENEEERRAQDAFMMAIDTVNSIMDRISKKHSAWEKEKAKIQIKAQIGEGNFGVVLLGTMPNEFGIIETVAIKTIKEQGIEVSALLDFEKEMEVMATLKHRNIVSLLGICTVSLPFYIIMEYMENGPLNGYLMKFAPSKDEPLGGLSVGQLAWMCQQPCDALEYLAANNMVHRDVSARNCLVGQNLQVKLADFGLSRKTSADDKNYYKKEGGMVPIKWMAPEALTYGRYTSANDIWAFGVLAWEVFSFGALPYQHLSNQQVMTSITKGERLKRPHICPEGLWEAVLKCWADKPEERIMFTALLAFLKDFSEETKATFIEGKGTEFSIPDADTPHITY